MSCEICNGLELELLADMGGARLVKCGACGHQQIVRAQPPRGIRWRDGQAQRLVEAAGEIDAPEPKPEGRY